MTPQGFGGFWNRLAEIEEMHRRMDELFNQAFGVGISGQGGQPGQMGFSEPDVDVYERDNEYVVHAALPGCRPEDIQLQATQDGIMLTCETRSPFQEQGQGDGSQPQGQQNQQNQQSQSGQQGQQEQYTPLRRSRWSSQSRMQFAYSFPEEINPNQVQAELRNGRLELRIPKAQPQRQGQPIRIQVQGGEDQSAGSIPQSGRIPQQSQTSTMGGPGSTMQPAATANEDQSTLGDTLSGGSRQGRAAGESMPVGSDSEGLAAGQAKPTRTASRSGKATGAARASRKNQAVPSP